MKTAIYIEDGITQLVFTPETNFEIETVEKISREEIKNLKIHKGSFYECQGGWVRQNGTEESIILQLSDKAA